MKSGCGLWTAPDHDSSGFKAASLISLHAAPHADPPTTPPEHYRTTVDV